MKKKLIGVISIVSILLFATGCQSTKQESKLEDVVIDTDLEENDVFSDEDEDIEFYEEDDDINELEDQYYKAKKNEKKKFSINDLFTSSFKVYPYGDASIFTPNAIGKMKQYGAEVAYFPKTETYGFGSIYLAAYYYVHFEEDELNNFQKAYKQYLKDFENKNLSRTNKKSTKVYGSAKVKLNYGTLKNSTINNGESTCFFGYKFVDKSPYFIMTIIPCFNVRYNDDDSAPTESLNLTYYLTKSQLKRFSELFSKDEINEVTRQYNHETYGEFTSPDEY